MTYRPASFFIFNFAFCIALAACGYQFGVDGPGPVIGGVAAAPKTAAPETAPRLTVMPFENRSAEPNLETKYTSYARAEFAAGSGTQVVSEMGRADLILKGQILSAIVPTLTFTLSQGTLESRVTVRVRGFVEDTRTRKVIWSYTSVGTSEFFVTNDLQFNRVLQDRALEQAGVAAAQDLAVRFLNHLETYGIAPAPATAVPPGEVPFQGAPGSGFGTTGGGGRR
jgi:Lipopolysaccharide-assembly